MRHFDSGKILRRTFIVACSLAFAGAAAVTAIMAAELGDEAATAHPVRASTDAPVTPKDDSGPPQDSVPKGMSEAEQRLLDEPIDLETPEALLETLDLGRAHFDALRDGQDLERKPASLKLLLRTLYRLPNMPPVELDNWIARNAADADLSTWSGDTRPHRRKFFSLPGRIYKLQEVPLPAETAELWTFDKYYRCHVVLGAAKVPAIVYAREVPLVWMDSQEKLDEAIHVRGMFLSRGENVSAAKDSASGPLLFAVDRLAWHPDTLLGNAGMDVGLFDTVKSGRKLHDSERDCFYGLLDTVGKIDQTKLVDEATAAVYARRDKLTERLAELEKQQADLNEQRDSLAGNPSKQAELAQVGKDLAGVTRDRMITESAIKTADKGLWDIVSVIQKPSQHKGELLKFRGTALRILRVPLGPEDRDVVLRYGIDHYYEIDAIVSLDLKIRVDESPKKPAAKNGGDGGASDTKDGNSTDERLTMTAAVAGPTEEGKLKEPAESPASEAKEKTPSKVMSRFPITFCVRTLPEGMRTGPHVSERIEIVGFHVKNWRFKTAEQTASGPRFRNAPMLIGRMPLSTPPPMLVSPVYGMIIGLLFAAALAVIWLTVWMLGRGDRAFEEATMSGRFAVAEGESLNRMDLPVESEPDFSHLRELDEFREANPADTGESGAASPDERDY